MLQVHVLLQILDNGSYDRGTSLRVQIIDQMFGNKYSQYIGKAGHRVDCLEEGSEKVFGVRPVRIVPVNTVLDSRKSLEHSLRR